MSRTRSVRRASSLDGVDVDPVTGGLLSIAELQAAMRRIPAAAAVAPALPMRAAPVPAAPELMAPVPVAPAGGRAARTAPDPTSVHLPTSPGLGAGLPGWLLASAVGGPAGVGPVGSGLICVVGAHPGAGCSTVAVAVADAAGLDPVGVDPAGDRGGRGASSSSVARAQVHLVECTAVTASGLAGVTSTELGLGPDGSWRHGWRGPVLVSRAAAGVPDRAPEPPDVTANLTVLDLGDLSAAEVGSRLPARAGVVVVCRANLPGLRRLEGLLAHLDRVPGGDRVVVAVVGPTRWAGPIRACLGPGLRSRDRAGLVVRVPIDRGLAVTGPTARALPRKVAAAGTGLWTAVRPAIQSLPPSPSSSSSSVDVRDAGADFFDQRWEQQ